MEGGRRIGKWDNGVGENGVVMDAAEAHESMLWRFGSYIFSLHDSHRSSVPLGDVPCEMFMLALIALIRQASSS